MKSAQLGLMVTMPRAWWELAVALSLLPDDAHRQLLVVCAVLQEAHSHRRDLGDPSRTVASGDFGCFAASDSPALTPTDTLLAANLLWCWCRVQKHHPLGEHHQHTSNIEAEASAAGLAPEVNETRSAQSNKEH